MALRIPKRIGTAAAAAHCPYSFSMTTCAVWTNRLRQWWWNDSGIRTIQVKRIWWKFGRCCPFQWIHMFDRIEFACVRFCFRLTFDEHRYIRCKQCACPTGMAGRGRMNSHSSVEMMIECTRIRLDDGLQSCATNKHYNCDSNARKLAGWHSRARERADQRVNWCIRGHIRKWPIRKWFYDTVSSFYVTKEKCVNAKNRRKAK